MHRFIELTAADKTESKLLFNASHIVSLTPDTFAGTCRLMVPGAMFEVKESYETIKAALVGH